MIVKILEVDVMDLWWYIKDKSNIQIKNDLYSI